MTEEDLLADLRAFAFGRAAEGAPRIGAEIEVIPVDAGTGRMAPIPSTLPLLRGVGASLGWEEEGGPAPKFYTPTGTLVAYEPGGQVEVSSPPCPSVGGVVRALREVVLPLREAARHAGVRLLEVGIDPLSAPHEVPLQLRSERYLLMDAHLASIGPAGARMMRQTASLQVNLDWAADVLLHWRVLNAAAPFLNALFAGSPVYAGEDTGAQSYRGLGWTVLDPGRTGLATDGDDPAAAYLRFALRAPAILVRNGEGPPEPFGCHLRRGTVGMEAWRAHLSTLFPEVRPRGYAELRSIDAVPAEWYAAPLTLLAGLSHPRALAAAAELLGEPRAELLPRAARRGLHDPEIAALAAELFRIGLEGARLAGEGWVERECRDDALAYFERYTRRGRAPADELRALTARRPLGSCR